LRKAIGDQVAQPPYLFITRQVIQFNSASEYWLDLTEFIKGLSPLRGERSKQLDPDSVVGLQAAIDLYHGRFLENFTIADSGAFEEWALLKREQLNRELIQALIRLAEYYEALGDFNQALPFAWKQVELERWQEEGHQQLMRLLALTGRRSEALAQYETCAEMLKKDLGVAPSEVTIALYETIRDGILTPGITRPLSILPFPGKPPYKGMEFFDEVDAGLFFGRERLILCLIEHLRNMLSTKERPQNRFLAILGASGSGKSSVLRAGLVPAIKTGQMPIEGTYPPQGSQNWPVHIITPTAHPLEALAYSLTSSSESQIATANLIDEMGREARSLHLFASKHISTTHDGRYLLIVVDQFEEIFTLCRAENERKAFIDNLLTAVESPVPVIVVIALRADFYAHCSRYQRLRQALSERQEYIGPMNSEELRQVIERPARKAGWDFEAGLVDLILRDTGDEPGALPLLSHALLETWQHRRGYTMTLEGYSETGGVGQAIAQTAESVFNRLTPEQQMIARRIFLRLTEPGEGALDTRRRTALDELLSSFGEAREIERVLKFLADARLITMSSDSVEVAHEALIREWPALREWLDQDRESLRLHHHLTEAALAWEDLDRDAGELYRGTRLAQVLEWYSQPENSTALNKLEQEFIFASQELAEQEVQSREAQYQRELESAMKLAEVQRQRAEVEAHRAEEQIRTASQLHRRALILAGTLLVALVMVALAALFAWREQRQTTIATARELALAAQNTLTIDPELSILLGLKSASSWTSVAQTVPYDLQATLHQAIPAARARLTWQAGGETILSVNYIQPGDSPRVITSDREEGLITVWDPVSNQRLVTIPGSITTGASGSSSPVVRPSPDGMLLAVASEKATTKLWDIIHRKELCSLSGNGNVIMDSFFSHAGDLLITQESTGYMIWDVSTCERLLEISVPGNLSKASDISQDGKYFAAVTQTSEISIFEIASGLKIFTVQAGFDLTVLAFSPDGKSLVGAGRENYFKQWDASTGDVITTFTSQIVREGQAEAIGYSPDGKHLLLMTTLYDPATGSDLFSLLGHSKPVSSLAFNNDGTRAITGSYDGTARIWDLTTEHEVLTLSHPSGFIYGVAFSPDGNLLATSGEDQTVTIWEFTTGRKLQILSGHNDIVNDAAFSPDGTLLATGSADQTVRVWDTRSWQVTHTLSGFGEDRTGVPYIRGVFDLAFSPTCQSASNPASSCSLAAVGHDGRLIVWDAVTGQKQMTYQDSSAGLMSVEFSPDGKLLATGNASWQGDDSWATILDASSGAVLRTLPSVPAWMWSLAFSPDGQRLGTINFYGDGKVWATESGELLVDIKGIQEGGYSITFNPDGTLLAVGSAGYVALVEAKSGQLMLPLKGHQSLVVRSAFSPDGKYLATASFDSTARIYVVPANDLLTLANSRLTRSWTLEECQKYLHLETCP
jgi:WD40 repeat protein